MGIGKLSTNQNSTLRRFWNAADRRKAQEQPGSPSKAKAAPAPARVSERAIIDPAKIRQLKRNIQKAFRQLRKIKHPAFRKASSQIYSCLSKAQQQLKEDQIQAAALNYLKAKIILDRTRSAYVSERRSASALADFKKCIASIKKEVRHQALISFEANFEKARKRLLNTGARLLNASGKRYQRLARVYQGRANKIDDFTHRSQLYLRLLKTNDKVFKLLVALTSKNVQGDIKENLLKLHDDLGRVILDVLRGENLKEISSRLKALEAKYPKFELIAFQYLHYDEVKHLHTELAKMTETAYKNPVKRALQREIFTKDDRTKQLWIRLKDLTGRWGKLSAAELKEYQVSHQEYSRRVKFLYFRALYNMTSSRFHDYIVRNPKLEQYYEQARIFGLQHGIIENEYNLRILDQAYKNLELLSQAVALQEAKEGGHIRYIYESPALKKDYDTMIAMGLGKIPSKDFSKVYRRFAKRIAYLENLDQLIAYASGASYQRNKIAPIFAFFRTPKAEADLRIRLRSINSELKILRSKALIGKLPEVSELKAIKEDTALRQAVRDIFKFNRYGDPLAKASLFAMGVAIVAMSGGAGAAAGGLVSGLLGGKGLLAGLAAFAANATVFTVTSRALNKAIMKQASTQPFWVELGTNAAMLGGLAVVGRGINAGLGLTRYGKNAAGIVRQSKAGVRLSNSEIQILKDYKILHTVSSSTGEVTYLTAFSQLTGSQNSISEDVIHNLGFILGLRIAHKVVPSDIFQEAAQNAGRRVVQKAGQKIANIHRRLSLPAENFREQGNDSEAPGRSIGEEAATGVQTPNSKRGRNNSRTDTDISITVDTDPFGDTVFDTNRTRRYQILHDNPGKAVYEVEAQETARKLWDKLQNNPDPEQVSERMKINQYLKQKGITDPSKVDPLEVSDWLALSYRESPTVQKLIKIKVAYEAMKLLEARAESLGSKPEAVRKLFMHEYNSFTNKMREIREQKEIERQKEIEKQQKIKIRSAMSKTPIKTIGHVGFVEPNQIIRAGKFYYMIELVEGMYVLRRLEAKKTMDGREVLTPSGDGESIVPLQWSGRGHPPKGSTLLGNSGLRLKYQMIDGKFRFEVVKPESKAVSSQPRARAVNADVTNAGIENPFKSEKDQVIIVEGKADMSKTLQHSFTFGEGTYHIGRMLDGNISVFRQDRPSDGIHSFRPIKDGSTVTFDGIEFSRKGDKISIKSTSSNRPVYKVIEPEKQRANPAENNQPKAPEIPLDLEGKPINSENRQELRNVEELKHGDILPPHSGNLDRPGSFNNRENLFINLLSGALPEFINNVAKKVAQGFRKISSSPRQRKELADRLAILLKDRFHSGQGEGVAEAGENKTIGAFMDKGGCCRHRAAALVAALQAVGIRSRYVRGIQGAINVESGKHILLGWHAWVEVDVKGDGTFSYLIDPNQGNARGQRMKVKIHDSTELLKDLKHKGLDKPKSAYGLYEGKTEDGIVKFYIRDGYGATVWRAK